MRYLSILFLCLLLFSACGDGEDNPTIPEVDDMIEDGNMDDDHTDDPDDDVITISDPSACDGHDNSAQFSSNRNFAFDLFQGINEIDADKNIFTSPMSVSMALTMLYNGTNGAGKAEMDEVMYLNGIDLESLNQNYYCLLQEITALDEAVVLNIANSIWSNDNFQAKEQFLALANDYLNSEYFSINFSDAGAVDEINGWISDNTEGKIENVIDQIPASAVMYLINAIYFNADWKYSFDPEKTYEGTFNGLSGSEGTVDFMNQTNDFLFFENEDYKLIDVPYGNEEFSLSIFLPTGNVNEFIADFSEADYVAALDQMVEREVRFTMPKILMEYKVGLNEPLQALGMNGIFQAGSLENIQEDMNLAVSRILHQSFLEIDEVGTEAAAVTVIEIVVTSVGDQPPFMLLNRPFVFYIRDRVNNNVLFSGKIVEL